MGYFSPAGLPPGSEANVLDTLVISVCSCTYSLWRSARQIFSETLSSTNKAVMTMQDLLALSAKYATRPAAEETINDPTVRRHYWRFRSHVLLEDVLADADFLGGLQDLLLGTPCFRGAAHGRLERNP